MARVAVRQHQAGAAILHDMGDAGGRMVGLDRHERTAEEQAGHHRGDHPVVGLGQQHHRLPRRDAGRVVEPARQPQGPIGEAP